MDTGTFETVPGNLTPNQTLDNGQALGDALTGSLTGTWGYPFTSTTIANATSAPPASMNGYGHCDPDGNGTECSGSWFGQFFASTATFTGLGANGTGPGQWSWSYTTVKDNCGNVETWVDANNDGGGQSTTAPFNTDITAPLLESCAG